MDEKLPAEMFAAGDSGTPMETEDDHQLARHMMRKQRRLESSEEEEDAASGRESVLNSSREDKTGDTSEQTTAGAPPDGTTGQISPLSGLENALPLTENQEKNSPYPALFIPFPLPPPPFFPSLYGTRIPPFFATSPHKTEFRNLFLVSEHGILAFLVIFGLEFRRNSVEILEYGSLEFRRN